MSASTAIVDSLYRISSLVSETDDTRQALSVVVEELIACLGASSASVALIDPDTKQLDIEVARGLPSDSPDCRLQLGQGVTGRVALHGKPLLVRDVRNEPFYIALKDSIRSEMAAPMIVRSLIGNEMKESIVGVVNVDSETVNAFTEDDLKLLTVLTNEATRVVARLWHINQLREKSRQLETVVNAGQRLVRQRESDRVLKSIARDARRLIRSRICAVYLLTPAGDRLKLECEVGMEDDRAFAEELDPADSVLGVAMRRKKQVSVFDLPKTEEHHFVEITQRLGLRSMLATPIVYDNEIIGLINLYTDVYHRFSNDERRLVQSLASLGAVAIQNARLYRRVFESDEAVRKNDRLTTLGLLAAEIAHEIRNPLTVIKLLFDSLELEFDRGDPRTQDVSVIGEKINQLEEIVGRVLDFGRSRTGLHARYDLRELVEDTIRLVRMKLEQSHIELVYLRPETPLQVEVHKGQLQQVIINLVFNAVQAMPNGGRLTLELHTKSGRVWLHIKDTGCGIAESLRERIFESFLSGRTEGTGLGLAIAKQILKAHRGGIELRHTSAQGTHFCCDLPLASKRA